MADPKFQSTFIPKRPVASGPAGSRRRKRSGSFSIVNMIVFIAFFLVLVVAGGLFGYTRFLEESIVEKDAQLNAEVENLDRGLIRELAVKDAQLAVAKSILEDHIVPSRFFAHLQDITLQNVQFVTFDFMAEPGRRPQIFMNGIADRYETVALQSDVFGTDEMIASSLFSGLNLGEEGGVVFDVEAQVSTRLTSYKQ